MAVGNIDKLLDLGEGYLKAIAGRKAGRGFNASTMDRLANETGENDAAAAVNAAQFKQMTGRDISEFYNEPGFSHEGGNHAFKTAASTGAKRLADAFAVGFKKPAPSATARPEAFGSFGGAIGQDFKPYKGL